MPLAWVLPPGPLYRDAQSWVPPAAAAPAPDEPGTRPAAALGRAAGARPGTSAAVAVTPGSSAQASTAAGAATFKVSVMTRASPTAKWRMVLGTVGDPRAESLCGAGEVLLADVLASRAV